jgi:hypothetical protein
MKQFLSTFTGKATAVWVQDRRLLSANRHLNLAATHQGHLVASYLPRMPCKNHPYFEA